MKLKKKLKKIKLLLLDVDGVLTDGSIILGESNQELKSFNITDGLRIKLAKAGGIEIGIITGRSSKAVKKRAEELDIKILYQGQLDKLKAYDQIKTDLGLADDQIAFIGDDLNDIKLIQRAGFSCTVIDACDEVKTEADYVTKRPGGKGAVKEVIEMILKRQGKWEALIQKYY